MKEIVICAAFYPWYREHDRTEEIFDVLVKSMMKMKQRHRVALSISDGGTKDIWNKGRRHDAFAFRERLEREWDGPLYYFVSDYYDHNRWWYSKCLEDAILLSSEPYLFLVGIDLWLPEDFVELYFRHVDSERCWVPFAYNILRGAPMKVDPENKVGNWHTAKGIVGVTRINYMSVGGWPVEYIKDRSDSHFYLRIASKFKITERRQEDLFHVAHPGSHGSKKWHIDQLENN